MQTETSLEELIVDLAKRARAASLKTAVLTPEQKNEALLRLAALIEQEASVLIPENEKDLVAGEEAGLSKALIDRLRLTPERMQGMAEGVRQVAALPDPVGELIEESKRPNGLVIKKVRVPIGVIGIIYESRPNVTIDCAALCLKSGNAAILRGGKEAIHTNRALAALIERALSEEGITTDAVQLVPTTDRAALNTLLKLDQYMHCIIPRGGEGLIRFVAENATMPVIKHYTGVCNLYLDVHADPDMAEAIAVNAKTQRPGVCNAIENLLVHRERAEDLLPQVAQALVDKGVELRVDSGSKIILDEAEIPCKEATEDDYKAEFLDLILAVKIVEDIDEAIGFINTYGSSHSDGIVTADEGAATYFMNGVDTATAYWNASTRFTDGFEFGLGAEIGISTDRLHARGPMGLRELCTYKYKLFGTGQIK